MTTKKLTLRQAAELAIDPEVATALAYIDSVSKPGALWVEVTGATVERHGSLVSRGCWRGMGLVVGMAKALRPELGKPATYNIGSDSYAGTITGITKCTITWTGEHGSKVARRDDLGHWRCPGGVGTIVCGDARATSLSREF